MIQDQLLKALELALPDKHSLNDAIATALDISYDAAHRRTSFKSKLSLEESVILAKYYNISLDQLYKTTDRQLLVVEKTKPIFNESALQDYFKDSYDSLEPLLNQNDCSILYSAKDIPLFYTIGSDLLSKFKIFVWLKLLDANFETHNFDTFSLHIDTISYAKRLKELYHNLQTTEIWDITTINSTLKQIHFYYEASIITTDVALALCNALNELIHSISKKMSAQSDIYKLYYNELLLMNNNVLVTTPKIQSLYVPFSILSYYQTSDKRTCQQAERYFNQQLSNSKLLNSSGEKEQRTFFNKMHQKVDALKQLIEATEQLNYE